MTALLKISALSAVAARSTLMAIQSKERLAPAPLTVSTTERNTPDDEINSFLSDIRAAYNLITDSSTAARSFVAYLTESADLDKYEIDAVKDVEQFFSEYGREDLIAAAIDDLNDALGTYTDAPEEAAADLTLDDVSFDCLEDAIKSEAESMTEALDIKKYHDKDGAASGAYVLIECGGPTLYFHWLDSAGAYVTATGRTTGGSETRRLGLEDLEIINQLYFFGELDI